jgi:predicted Ser/Thr protein kinase
MELYAKGKRGIIYKEGKACIKTKNPEAEVDTLKNEADYLKKLNKEGIGMKFIKYSDGKLYREFVDGERISDFLEQETGKEKIISVIRQVLEQCRKLDLLGIDKKELTNPYKDIIITPENKAVLIDFERCRQTKKPKNVTQFMQYIARNKGTLESKGIIIDKEKLIKLGKEYKNNPSKGGFEEIINFISNKPVRRMRTK